MAAIREFLRRRADAPHLRLLLLVENEGPALAALRAACTVDDDRLVVLACDETGVCLGRSDAF